MIRTTPDYSVLMVFGFMLAELFWLVTLVHCLGNQKLRDVEKVTWVIVIVFLNVLGAGLYVIVRSNTDSPPPPTTTS